MTCLNKLIQKRTIFYFILLQFFMSFDMLDRYHRYFIKKEILQRKILKTFKKLKKKKIISFKNYIGRIKKKTLFFFFLPKNGV